MFQKIGQVVEALANIATLIGLGIAFYALVNPATVSEYLVEVSANTLRSAESLDSIDAASMGTEANTRVLADEVPYWIETGNVFKYEDALSVTLENNSRYVFRDVRITFGSPRQGKLWHLEGAVVAPREILEVEKNNPINSIFPATYCMSAENSANGVRYYEARELGSGSINGDQFFTSYAFSTEPIDACAFAGH